jgi:hypothetical protein
LFSQSLSLQTFHDDKPQSTLVPYVEENHDIGMGKRGNGPGLTLESREHLEITREMLWQDLDRDIPAEPRIARTKDLSHSASTQKRRDFVGADVLADSNSHQMRVILRLERVAQPCGRRRDRRHRYAPCIPK